MDKLLEPLALYMYFRSPLEIKSYAHFISRIRCQVLPEEKTIMQTFYFCDLCSYSEECKRMRELQRGLIKEYERNKESE